MNKTILPIKDIQKKIGIKDEELEPYGKYFAKVNLSLLKRLKEEKEGKYIIVTAINPTSFGEGKTTTSIGLTQGLGKIGHKSTACLRQTSLGPMFGIKGGATGGGKSLVVPFDLHLTGDMHAISIAHNLIAAAVDARLMHERNYSDEKWEKKGLKKINLDPYNIIWKRIVDINDRVLRNIIIGLGSKDDGYPRESGFDITPASELIAILSLAKDYEDMRKRIGKIVIGYDKNKKPVTAEDLKVAGSASALLVKALLPNLLQTLEGQAAFVHTGPFANIAHGNSSVLADLIALKLSDYVITEAGFGADMGLEKFFNIKCRASGKMPHSIVLVATIRALKMHGGGPKIKSGTKIPAVYLEENIELLEKGLEHLKKHIENCNKFGVNTIVAINKFPTDTKKELEFLQNKAKELNGVFDAVVCEHFEKGGDGAIDLANAVVKACETESSPELLYKDSISIKEKIESIAKNIYGAKNVLFSEKAKKQIKKYQKQNYGNFPICMSKTQYSFSHDPSKLGVPKDFTLPIREIKCSVGAGFLLAICGDMQLMPGLPSQPSYINIDIDSEGNITGI